MWPFEKFPRKLSLARQASNCKAHNPLAQMQMQCNNGSHDFCCTLTQIIRRTTLALTIIIFCQYYLGLVGISCNDNSYPVLAVTHLSGYEAGLTSV